MTDDEKNRIEQIAGVASSSADMITRVVLRLVNFQKLSPDEGALILGDLVGDQRDLARRFAPASGAAHVCSEIADRLAKHKAQLEKDTGAQAQRAMPKR